MSITTEVSKRCQSFNLKNQEHLHLLSRVIFGEVYFGGDKFRKLWKDWIKCTFGINKNLESSYVLENNKIDEAEALIKFTKYLIDKNLYSIDQFVIETTVYKKSSIKQVK